MFCVNKKGIYFKEQSQIRELWRVSLWKLWKCTLNGPHLFFVRIVFVYSQLSFCKNTSAKDVEFNYDKTPRRKKRL